MEKIIPPYPLTVVREEINLQYQETWDEKILTLRIQSTRKLIKNDGPALPLAFGKMPEGEGRGTAVVEDEGSGSGAR
jgi:hypothetical protein